MQIYEILRKDHEEIKALLNELVSLRNDDEYRFVLVSEIKNLLIPHARAEEIAFYQTLRAVDADKSIVAHGYKEHAEAEVLLGLLEKKDRSEVDWKTTALKLRDALGHHITEEETKIFLEAEMMFSNEEAVSIGESFLSLKAQYLGEGSIKNSTESTLELLPPRLVKSIRDLDSSKQ